MSLLQSLSGLTRKFRLLGLEKCTTDSVVFRLHYMLTSAVFFASSALVTAYQYFGNPIQCDQGGANDDTARIMTTYCWFSGTFTLSPREGFEPLYPGVYPGGGKKIFHTYYQWIPFLLVLQGVMFVVPHLVWVGACGRKMARYFDSISTDKEEEHRATRMATYFFSDLNGNDPYGYAYLGLHFCNLLNAVGHFFLIKRYIGNAFLTYGIDMLEFFVRSTEEGVNPAEYVFPRVTKCLFRKYGASGTMQIHDGLCVLALNVVNDKVYAVLWFWLLFLASVTAAELVLELFLLFVPSLRRHTAILFFPKGALKTTKAVVRRLQYGDYFILRTVGNNMKANTFVRFIEKMRFPGNGGNDTPATSGDEAPEARPLRRRYNV